VNGGKEGKIKKGGKNIGGKCLVTLNTLVRGAADVLDRIVGEQGGRQ